MTVRQRMWIIGGSKTVHRKWMYRYELEDYFNKYFSKSFIRKTPTRKLVDMFEYRIGGL